MARIRTIKPSFFTSLTIADLAVEQRLTFIGLWTHVDDEGRCEYDPRLIKAALWPLDDRSFNDMDDDIRALTEASLITHYKVGNRRYLQVNSWNEHQRINRATKSTLPPVENGEICSVSNDSGGSLITHGALTEDSLGEGKGKERKGKDSATRGEPDGTPRETTTTQTIIAAWIDSCETRPPGDVIGQLSKRIKTMLDEGIPTERIIEGVHVWQQRGLNPATLPSVVHEISTTRQRGTQRTPNRVQDNLAVVARIAARESAEQARLEITK